jgi:acyl carrier protein
LKEIIINLIREMRPYVSVSEDSELIKSGILDSLSIIALVTALEDEFGIEIADDAVTAKNFSTVPEIMRLVKESNKE